jgi:hypothetical protein
MAKVKATVQRTIEASADKVIAALADYQVIRPQIQPEQYFEYDVKEGGRGTGTLVHWKLQATSKRVRDCLYEVSEPEGHNPGVSRLVESDKNSSMVNTYEVTRVSEQRSVVTVTTTWNGASGIGGFFERTFAPKGLARIHEAQFDKLAEVIASI